MRYYFGLCLFMVYICAPIKISILFFGHLILISVKLTFFSIPKNVWIASSLFSGRLKAFTYNPSFSWKNGRKLKQRSTKWLTQLTPFLKLAPIPLNQTCLNVGIFIKHPYIRERRIIECCLSSLTLGFVSW